MNIAEFNRLSVAEAKSALEKCCTATNWVQAMLSSMPYQSRKDLLSSASASWNNMHEPDWLEAFDGHPKIGDPDSLKKKYRSTHALASGEQSGVQTASEQTILALAQANQSYVERFGFIFIICATGKSADEMLESIDHRLGNSRMQELETAAREQLKITLIRLNNLVTI